MESTTQELEAVQAAESAPVVAVIGQVIETSEIPGADRIHLAVANCAEQGVWRGVVTKDIVVGAAVLVLLQDALLPPENPRWAFMEKSKFRVRMARFKGCRSECVILPAVDVELEQEPGTEAGLGLGITKFSKPLPAEMAGKAKGNFPSCVEKTDEPNFQRVRELHEILADEWEARIKYDGTSGTSLVTDGVLRVCSRNLELEDDGNLYFRMAHQYMLQRIPEGLALQFEIIGPGVQGNPMGLEQNEIRAFTLFDIVNRCKAPTYHLDALCAGLGIPVAEVVYLGHGSVASDDLVKLAEVKYQNGRHGEGIVIRDPQSKHSVKVINLLYKD